MSYQGGTQDQVPQGWQAPQHPQPVYGQPQTFQQAYGQPPQQPYYAPPGYYPPQPVQVNVVQNAGPGAVAVIKPINHTLHWVLIFFTGGLWLLVYIPLLKKRRKIVVYR